MKKKTNFGLKIICLNRKASFNYFFNELIEAGIVLKGSEIKSIRSGKVNIGESYAVEKDGEIVLLNSHIRCIPMVIFVCQKLLSKWVRNHHKPKANFVLSYCTQLYPIAG